MKFSIVPVKLCIVPVPVKLCSVDGCGGKHLARGWCTMHYQRQRNGIPFDAPRQIRRPGALCSVDGCERKHAAKGLCGTHHFRARHGLSLDTPVRGPRGVCSHDGCERSHMAKGLCERHYKRLRMGIPLDGPVYLNRTACSVDGCERAYLANGLCAKHNERRRRGLPLDAPLRLRPRWAEEDKRLLRESVFLAPSDDIAAALGRGRVAYGKRRYASGMQPDRIPLSHVSVLLGVASHTVLMWVKKGKLPIVQASKTRRFVERNALCAFLSVWDAKNALERRWTPEKITDEGLRAVYYESHEKREQTA